MGAFCQGGIVAGNLVRIGEQLSEIEASLENSRFEARSIRQERERERELLERLLDLVDDARKAGRELAEERAARATLEIEKFHLLAQVGAKREATKKRKGKK